MGVPINIHIAAAKPITFDEIKVGQEIAVLSQVVNQDVDFRSFSVAQGPVVSKTDDALKVKNKDEWNPWHYAAGDATLSFYLVKDAPLTEGYYEWHVPQGKGGATNSGVCHVDAAGAFGRSSRAPHTVGSSYFFTAVENVEFKRISPDA